MRGDVLGAAIGVVLLVLSIVMALSGHTVTALLALIAGLLLGYGGAIRYRQRS